MRKFALIASLFGVGVTAFLPAQTKKKIPCTAQRALWRHFVPRDETIFDESPVSPAQEKPPVDDLFFQKLTQTLTACLLAAALSLPANAVSGGGLDFANLDITGQDFSGNTYKGKDFTQTIAKGTKFMNSNLQGCRFYKAYLVCR